MANKAGTSNEKWSFPSEIDWLTFGKVGDSATGEAYKKVQNVPQALQVDATDSNNVYIGYAIAGSATSGSSWRIMKLQTSGSSTSITWADGNSLYDNVWDNRASLSYS